MKTIVKSHYKMFFANLKLLLIFALSLLIPVFLLGFHFSRCGHNPLFYLQICQESCQWILLVDMFLSYEYIYSIKRSGMSDVLRVLKNGTVKAYGVAILVLLSIVLAQGLPFFVFPVVSALKAGMLPVMISQIFQAVVLNVILLGFASVSFGAFTALLCKRTVAYCLMFVVFFMALPASELFPGALYSRYKINIYKFREFFSCLLPSAQGWTVDYQYGIPLEAYRWCLLLLWFLVPLCLFFFRLVQGEKRKRLLTGGAAVLAAVLCFPGFLFAGSHLDTTSNPDSTIRADQAYYRKHHYVESEAPFEITAYDMSFKIGRGLTSQLRMYLQSDENPGELQFTLYHAFDIEKIEDENHVSLPFERDGDYFTVTCQKFPQYLDVSYQGSCNLFYSNYQATCLPGCFPYYPWAGFKKIHFLSPDPEDHLIQFIPRESSNIAHFFVTVKGGRNIMTNLPEISDGVYEGDSASFTMMGGFLEEWNQDGYSLAKCSSYPEGYGLTTEYFDELQAELDVLTGDGEKIDLKEYKLFEMPETMINRSYFTGVIAMENHIFLLDVDPSRNAEELLFQIRNGPILDINEMFEHRGLQ